MKFLQASIVINRPREFVFDCVTSMAFLQEWVAPLRSQKYTRTNERQHREKSRTLHIPELRQVSEGTIKKGTIFRQTDRSKHPPREATLEITDHERPSIFALNIHSFEFEASARLSLKATSNGTRLKLMLRVHARIWLLQILIFVTSLLARMRKASYMNRLQKYIEDQC